MRLFDRVYWDPFIHSFYDASRGSSGIWPFRSLHLHLQQRDGDNNRISYSRHYLWAIFFNSEALQSSPVDQDFHVQSCDFSLVCFNCVSDHAIRLVDKQVLRSNRLQKDTIWLCRVLSDICVFCSMYNDCNLSVLDVQSYFQTRKPRTYFYKCVSTKSKKWQKVPDCFCFNGTHFPSMLVAMVCFVFVFYPLVSCSSENVENPNEFGAGVCYFPICDFHS